MNAKHLLLDLDNTLYLYEDPHNQAISTVLKTFSNDFEFPLPEVEKTYRKARKKNHLELPNRAASHNRLLYFQNLLELMGKRSLDHGLKYYEQYWNTFLNEMQLSSGVEKFFQTQISGGAKICVLTDLTAHIQYRKIAKLGISKYIDFIVTSEEVGAEKPHPYMFLKALNKLQCDVEDAVMIGDNWEKDIVGANALNIEAIWINQAKEDRDLPEKVTEVTTFDQIRI